MKLSKTLSLKAMHLTGSVTSACLLLLTTSSVAYAEEASSLSWSGAIEAEREYDSSVSLEQIDKVSRERDYASQLKWSVAGKWQATDSLKLAASYQGKHRVYDQTSAFDLDQHHLALSSKYTFSGVGYSYRYDHAKAKVDGARFLDFSQSTLAIDKLFQSRYFVRAAYSSNKKDFAQLSERNAQAHLGSLDSMVFFDQGKRHVSLNLTVEDETARASLYDNTTHSLRLGYQYTFTQLAFPTSFTSSVLYSQKRYDSFAVDDSNDSGLPLLDSNSNETRVDKKTQFSLGFEVALTPWLDVMMNADYINNASNYSLVDNNEHLVSVGLKASF